MGNDFYRVRVLFLGAVLALILSAIGRWELEQSSAPNYSETGDDAS